MPRNHEVRAGDCISSLAFENGLYPDTLWNDPANAELKALRKDMNILQPGDRVFIPDKRPKIESGSTGRRYRFKLRGMPVKFRLRLVDGDTVLADVSYELDIDGRRMTGRSDADGMIDRWIPANAHRGVLRLEDGQEYPFQLGHLNPITEEPGVRERLENLALLTRGADEAAYKRAVLEFIHLHCPEHRPEGDLGEIAVESLLNDDVRNRLVEVHGS